MRNKTNFKFKLKYTKLKTATLYENQVSPGT